MEFDGSIDDAVYLEIQRAVDILPVCPHSREIKTPFF